MVDAIDYPELDFIRNIFEEYGEKYKFSVGQIICTEKYLPGRIYFIKKGNARLITNFDGVDTTLKKLLPNDLIGMASLLKGKSCEEVRASEELIALGISDEKFFSLYKENLNLRKICDEKIWEPELIFFTKRLLDNKKIKNASIQEIYEKIYRDVEIIPSNLKGIKKALENKKRIFLSTFISKNNEGIEIVSTNQFNKIKSIKKNFSVRIISIPDFYTNFDFKEEKKLPEEEIKSKENFKSQTYSNKLPPVSSFNDLDENENILVKGEGPIDGTLACFKMLSNLIGFPFRRDTVEKVLKEFLEENNFISLQLCAKIGSYHALQVSIAKLDPTVLTNIKTPGLIKWKNTFAIILNSNQKGIKLATPSEGYLSISSSEINNFFKEDIEILFLERSNITQNKSFGPSWFFPAIKKYRGVLIQVLIASFVVQLFTLANPLLIQVIIDKVISQRSLDTLQVLGFALLIVTLLEGILSALKTFLLSETTNRIDQKLASEVIDHLLGLPLYYFQIRPTGELSSRVSELEKIRNFLTGQAFTTILDATFSVIYIFVMLLYSISLTLISLLVLPIQIFITLVGAPLFRRQFRGVAEANAKTESHLVEVLNGIETVKSQNVEIKTRWKWQELYSKYINRNFEKTITGTTLVQTSQVLQKISQLFVLWVGARMVLNGSLTLGQLIAFRIISGYVTQPILRVSTIWQDIQELKVSFDRLADVIDTPKENNELEKSKISIPKIKGSIIFERIKFNFFKESKPILNNINLSIESKKLIGVVGQSGSGKSTLMKLLPRLYKPNEGKILIDGYDIQKVELDSLRRQIGIVPQDSLLFRGTIRDNISLTNSEISEEEIINAAKMANAHDFIMDLPNGYSTEVRERGSSLSGGQRQRITIARTLLSKPKILILDEATSALDYESERKVCDNLSNNLDECTVFFITHRLSNVKKADSIIVMHQGIVDEVGTHEELIKKKGRYYALYRQQGDN